jgi:hypothetical protein
LEAEVLKLQEENEKLKGHIQTVRERAGGMNGVPVPRTDRAEAPRVGTDLVSEIGILSLEGASERRFVGESSGIHFGKIIEALLPATDYKHEQGPAHSQLRLRLARKSSPASTNPSRFRPTPLPSIELGNSLKEAYFSNRWPSLPFLHKSNFVVNHFTPVMSMKAGLGRVSLFLTYMVFALGAIDLRRQKRELKYNHLDYFQTALISYLDGLVETDNIETVQGFLLMSLFAINEPQSLNAWLVSGLAIRTSIDLGLHRRADRAKYSYFQSEMRKRVFWVSHVPINILLFLRPATSW